MFLISEPITQKSHLQIHNLSQDPKTDEILNLLKQFPRSLSTKEIEKNFSHFSKQRIHSILQFLVNQGAVNRQPGFGIEAWKFNPNLKQTIQNVNKVNQLSKAIFVCFRILLVSTFSKKGLSYTSTPPFLD